MLKRLLIVTLILVSSLSPALTAGATTTTKTDSILAVTAGADWPMAGANPERTSRNTAVINPGALAPAWSTVIAPHILNKTQVIAANDTLYVSTAKGLYGLYANTGAQKWFYPTSMPLGNSPTVYKGVAYVGGFDNQLHAINALTGVGIWKFMAGAGFDTNPLAITVGTQDMIFAGNRDGYVYALYANGTLAWKYKTNGPIHFSAAYQSPNIYFASNDLSGYALNAATGVLAWKSAALPSADGFQSWWPVIAGNSVIFGNSRGYRPGSGPQLGTGNLDDDILPKLDNTGVVLNAQGARVIYPRYTPNNVTVPANRVAAMTNALNYFEDMPWRRSFYFLNATTGVEQTFDLDADGKTDYAPLMNAGTNNGTRYPVMIGPDPNSTALDEIYSFNNYASNDYTQGVAGWKPGTTFVTTPSGGQTNGDEPIAFAGMGDYISISQCCDRSARLYNPKTGQDWSLYSYDLAAKFPGYGVKATGTTESNAVRVFGTQNGVYGYHGDQNPLIAYTDSAGVTRLYFHRSNAILAFAPNVSGAATNRVLANPVVSSVNPAVSITTLQQTLIDQVTKVIAAGHLRPGYGTLSAWSLRRTIGDYFADYFNNPGDTLYALSLAYAALPADQVALKASLKTYLDNEYANYSPCVITHVGFEKTAAARENFILPREVSDAIASGQNNVNDGIVIPQTSSPFWGGKSPLVYYSLWKYVTLTGNTSKAASMLSSCGDIGSPPAVTAMRELPFIQNAWIAGLYGYMRLQEIAGQTVNSTRNSQYNSLLADRAANFNKDQTWGGPDTNSDKQQLAVARNFLYMTPELGNYLRTNALAKVQTAFDEYQAIAPYWFVTRFEETYSEGVMEHLYDYAAMSSAKAYIFSATREDLAKTVDVPAFARGDLFYIQNLVNAIQAPTNGTPSATATPVLATATNIPPAATATRTPTTLPTAQPTATGSETVNPASISVLPSGTRVLLDFNNFNPAVDNQPVQTSCGGLNWSSIVEGSPWAGNSTWNVYIQNGGSIGTIAFPRSVRVTSMRVSSLGSNTFTLTSPGNPDVVLTTSGNLPQTLTTNWINPVTQLTLRSTSADQIFDDLRFVLADSASTPTFTPLPTLTRTATAIATATRTPTRTATATATRTPTRTSTAAATATRTPTRTATAIATASKTPLPTNTPTRTPAATGTSIPPTATPLPGTEVINPSNVGALLPGAKVLLNFNNYPSPVDNQSVPVGYSGLIWSSLAEGSPWAGHTTWNFYMTNGGPVGTITFPVPVIVTSILASSIGSNVLTLSSPGNPDVSVTTTGSAPKTLTTNWANPVTVLTLRSSTGDQAFDDLRFVLANTAASATPTRTPTSTATRTSTPLPTYTATPVSTATSTPIATATSTPGSTSDRISGVTVLSPTIGLYNKQEIALTVNTPAQSKYLPFDQGGVSVDMNLTAPSGATRHTACFYYQPVDANLMPIGNPDWRCRFAPDEIGTWQFTVKLLDSIGSETSAVQTFAVTTSTNHGYVTTSGNAFKFSDGAPFNYPLINIETGSPLGSLEAIRSSITRFAQQGTRFVRWFPTGESANFFVVPYGDDLKSSWGFGSAWLTAINTSDGQGYSFFPYYWSGQNATVVSGGTYQLTLRARIIGNKVFRPSVGNTTIDITSQTWQNYTLTATAAGSSLAVWLHDGYSDTDNTTGEIQVYDVALRRDGTGPNLLTRSDPDTFAYVDQIGAARLDETLRLSEQQGVYHKLTLFHKNDEILDRLTADGTATENWSLDNFYAGGAVRNYLKAYARYFAARWGYSTALHSVELANENMLTTASYDTAFDVYATLRQNEPRHILLSNSFWGYFVSEFWTDSRAAALTDYADKHWYARQGSTNEELTSSQYGDSAAVARQCSLGFDAYRSAFGYTKPIVRGETGVWPPTGDAQLDLGSGAATFYHKQVWSQVGDSCAGEWYTAGVDFSEYARYTAWLDAEPLNSSYIRVGTDLTGANAIVSSNPEVRAWGWINPTTGRGLIWADNRQDTWLNLKNGVNVPAVSTTLTLAGLSGPYDLTTTNTTTGATTTQTGVAQIVLSGLAHDVALRVVRR